jgi:hypothetical protein
VGEFRDGAGEDEFPGAEQSFEPIADFSAEYDLQYRNRHQKVRWGVNPSRLVRRDSPARNDAMHMGVMASALTIP